MNRLALTPGGVQKGLYGTLLLAVLGISASIALSSVAFGLCCVLLLVRFWTTDARGGFRTPLDGFLLAYCAAELITSATSIDRATALFYSKRLLLILALYAAVVSVDSENRLRNFLGLVLGLNALMSVLESVVVLDTSGTIVRLGLFQHYMTAGGMKMFFLLLALPFLVHRRTPRVWRRLAAAVFLPTLLALVLTETRSAWLGLVGGAAVIGLLMRKSLLAGLAAAVVLFILFAPRGLQARAFSIVDLSHPSTVDRFHKLEAGWKMVQAYPILGTGDIDLGVIYTQYRVPGDPNEGGHLHNNLMMFLVTLGMIGTVALAALFARIAQVELACVRATRDDWLLGSTAAGCLAAFVGFHISGLFEWNFGDHEIALLLWLTVGLSIACRRIFLLRSGPAPHAAPEAVAENDRTTPSPPARLSVIVITRNEERNIGDCLKSVAWADDIVVVDSQSTDRTAEIARTLTRKVVTTEWMGYGEAKNLALQHADHDWVLWLDADERVTAELAAEIQHLLCAPPPPGIDAYEVARRAYFLGKWIKHCGWYPGYVARLFRRSAARFTTASVHERLVVTSAGQTGRLRNDLLHYTDETLYHYLAKFNRYTSLAARDLGRARNRRGNSLTTGGGLILRPIFLFFKMYVLRRGFLDGMHGLVLCLLSAAYVFTKYAKLWELEHPPSVPLQPFAPCPHEKAEERSS